MILSRYPSQIGPHDLGYNVDRERFKVNVLTLHYCHS